MTERAGARRAAFIRLLFWGAALIALVMAVLPHPPALPGNPSDKVQHVMAFAALAGLGAAAYPRLPAIRLAAALSIFGLGIEIVQAIPALNRDSDWVDWAADTLACAAVLIGIALWRRRRR
ncbi:MAG TPA: hypothetical protein VIL42_08750 [Sphingomicrobium sp.]